jgi:predicted ABC-type ATPase
VVAGPNGSGKSTLTSSIWFEGNANLIDPDAIARRLNATQPARSAIPAAREAILRCKALLADSESFTLETTLAGHGAIGIARQAKNAGYRTLLVYVSLGDPELHIDGVRLCVSQGGHDIPDADIRRRYWRSLMHAPVALRLVDKAVVLDNSGFHPLRMPLLNGCVVWREDALPEWIRRMISVLLPRPANPLKFLLQDVILKYN